VIALQHSITNVNQFADRLRYVRLLRGLTQAKLAKASGLSQGAIANYEGKSRHSAKGIFKLAEVLQVSAQWLSEGAGPMELPIRLSTEVSEYQSGNAVIVDRMPVWPFKSVSPQAYWRLSSQDRAIIEKTVATLVEGFLNKETAD